ncbi:MAG: MarC family protein [Bacteroidota bacterium]
MELSIKDISTIALTLFAVIDILGALPVIINIRQRDTPIDSGWATVAAGFLMVIFLVVGERLLALFGIDVASFAVAGAIVIFIIALEMVLGIDIFRADPNDKAGSIIPIAFPIIAGSGTLTTIISLKAVYSYENIMAGIVVNLLIVYVALKSTSKIERLLGKAGLSLLRKFFGIVLLAIAVKLFKTNF